MPICTLELAKPIAISKKKKTKEVDTLLAHATSFWTYHNAKVVCKLVCYIKELIGAFSNITILLQQVTLPKDRYSIVFVDLLPNTSYIVEVVGNVGTFRSLPGTAQDQTSKYCVVSSSKWNHRTV